MDRSAATAVHRKAASYARCADQLGRVLQLDDSAAADDAELLGVDLDPDQSDLQGSFSSTALNAQQLPDVPLLPPKLPPFASHVVDDGETPTPTGDDDCATGAAGRAAPAAANDGGKAAQRETPGAVLSLLEQIRNRDVELRSHTDELPHVSRLEPTTERSLVAALSDAIDRRRAALREDETDEVRGTAGPSVASGAAKSRTKCEKCHATMSFEALFKHKC